MKSLNNFLMAALALLAQAPISSQAETLNLPVNVFIAPPATGISINVLKTVDFGTIQMQSNGNLCKMRKNSTLYGCNSSTNVQAGEFEIQGEPSHQMQITANVVTDGGLTYSPLFDKVGTGALPTSTTPYDTTIWPRLDSSGYLKLFLLGDLDIDPTWETQPDESSNEPREEGMQRQMSLSGGIPTDTLIELLPTITVTNY